MKKILLVFLFFVFLFNSCQEKKEGISAPKDNVRTPDQIIEGFSLVETESGKKQWILKAKQAFSYEKESRVEITSVILEFYKEEEKLYSTLISDEGIVNTVTHDMEAVGNVVVKSEDGGVLSTKRLRWENAIGKIVSDDTVRITKGKTVITGRGFESDPSLEHIVIKQEFRAHSSSDRKK